MAKKDTSEKRAAYHPQVGHVQAPYGWRWAEDGSAIEEDAAEQENITLVKTLSGEGASLRGIQSMLLERGVKNRAGNASWTLKRLNALVKQSGLSAFWRSRKQALDRQATMQPAALQETAQPVEIDLPSEPDPVRWGEALLANRDGSARAYWAHQVEDLRAEDANIIHLDGRDVGKTANLATLALHYALTTPNGTGLIAAALGGQLLSILEEIEFQLERNALLDECVAVAKGGRRKFQRSPYPRIEFSNGSVLYFRPAGAYGEAFRSLHVARIWVDEGAWLSEEAWRALRGCLKQGGKLRVYSTPNGVRNSTYYRLTQSTRWRVFRWPSWISPQWDTEREADLLEFYGGRGSAGWQHEVAGEHGAVSYGAFPSETFAHCVGDVLEYRRVTIAGEELADCATDDDITMRFETLLDTMPTQGTYWIGGDLGYTRDPTEIVVFREEESDDRKTLRLVLRVHMESVGYPHIAQCLAVLDAAYAPEAIGIDNGGNGLAVVQELMSLDRYRSRNFDGRLLGFDFGSVTTIPLADGSDGRKRTKELMTSLINGALQRRELLFPADDREIEDQFLTQTYSLSNGMVVYSKGNDHIIDAVRCMMLGRENLREDGMLAPAKGERYYPPPVIYTYNERWSVWDL